MTDALMVRPLPITVDMLTTNAVESYDDVDYHVLYAPETQRNYAIYNYGDIVRDAVNNRLFQSIVPDYQRLSCTMTNANPIVVTSTAHGLANGDLITFLGARTGDTLAEDVDKGRPCWVRNVTTDTFEFAYDRDEDSNSVGVILGDPGSGVAYFYKGDTNSSYWNPTVPPGDDGYSESLADLIADLGDIRIVSPRWLDLGPDNTMAMFDGYNGTTSVFPSGADVTIIPGTRADAIGFEDLLGASVRIVVNDGSSDIYDQTYELVNNSEVVDYYSFFFGERWQIQTLVVDDLPDYVLAPQITVTGPTQIGNCAPGRQFSLGDFEQSMDVGSRSFTSVTIDETFGTYSTTQRRPAKKANGSSVFASSRVDIVRRVLDDHDGVPVFWRLSDGFEATLIFGLCRDYTIALGHSETQSQLTCQIEGMI